MGRRLVIEGAGGLPLDDDEAEIIGRIVADALVAENLLGLVQVVDEEVEGADRG